TVDKTEVFWYNYIMKQRQPERMVGMAEKASTAVEAANIVEQPGAGMVRAGLLPSTDLARVMLAAARRRIAPHSGSIAAAEG
ncbi:hypothetical protein, partial [Victivallis lenta]|uniref:hypothetical protein n=2 Tax=Victivallis lenta TaxID=2606640 RepID=UPI003AF21F57